MIEPTLKHFEVGIGSISEKHAVMKSLTKFSKPITIARMSVESSRCKGFTSSYRQIKLRRISSKNSYNYLSRLKTDSYPIKR